MDAWSEHVSRDAHLRYEYRLSVKTATDKGQKKQAEKWFVSLEVDPRWTAMASAGMESRAFGVVPPAAQLEALVTTAEELESEPLEGELLEEGEIGEEADRLSQILADLHAMRDSMPRGLSEGVDALKPFLGSAFDERSLFLHVRDNLHIGRAEKLSYNTITWGAMVDVVNDLLVTQTDREEAA